jgi:hypothetical protein
MENASPRYCPSPKAGAARLEAKAMTIEALTIAGRIRWVFMSKAKFKSRASFKIPRFVFDSREVFKD